MTYLVNGWQLLRRPVIFINLAWPTVHSFGSTNSSSSACEAAKPLWPRAFDALLSNAYLQRLQIGWSALAQAAMNVLWSKLL